MNGVVFISLFFALVRTLFPFSPLSSLLLFARPCPSSLLFSPPPPLTLLLFIFTTPWNTYKNPCIEKKSLSQPNFQHHYRQNLSPSFPFHFPFPSPSPFPFPSLPLS
ncbi:MAG: hypothetical protein J3R72DRAFT_441361 [Linnemannia gamsii]|nr:MAG: hypothetical protein J3R72DRAFT_441361 [Linnemannia gamsii]